MKHAMLILNLCIAALLAATTLARAAPRDISAEIAALRPSIVSAKVYAVENNLTGRINRSEESVARGCYYAATGDDLSALLDVLASGELKEAAPRRYGVDARTVIYLATRNGTTTALTLSREFSTQAIRGDYDRTVPVEARMGLGAALGEWEARRTLTSPTSESCTGFFHFD